MQVLTDGCYATERDQARLNQELFRLFGWDAQLAVFVREFKERASYFDKYTAEWPSGPVSLPEQQLRELSNHFHEVRRKQHAHVSQDLSCSRSCV